MRTITVCKSRKLKERLETSGLLTVKRKTCRPGLGGNFTLETQRMNKLEHEGIGTSLLAQDLK